MATLRLNDRRVTALKLRKSAYDIRDRDLKGFGVRVPPSGAKRYFIHSQHRGRRVWKIVGRAGTIGADEARDRAGTLLAAIWKGNEDEAAARPIHRSRQSPTKSSGDTQETGSRRRSASTGATTGTRSCPGSKGARSGTPRPTTSDAGSRRCTIPRRDRPLRPHPLGHHAPSRSARRPAPSRLLSTRPQVAEHDAALRSCGRSGDRGVGGTHRCRNRPSSGRLVRRQEKLGKSLTYDGLLSIQQPILRRILRKVELQKRRLSRTPGVGKRRRLPHDWDHRTTPL